MQNCVRATTNATSPPRTYAKVGGSIPSSPAEFPRPRERTGGPLANPLPFAVCCGDHRGAVEIERRGHARMIGKAYLMVRAEIADAADRPGFDEWYEKEHLPDAVAKFGAERGWRCWSRINPGVHYAFYEFADPARAQAILDSPALRALIAEFDRAWGSRVTRTREIMEVVGAAAP
jgi:hypothetical protein